MGIIDFDTFIIGFFSRNSKYGPSTSLQMCSLLLKERTFFLFYLSE